MSILGSASFSKCHLMPKIHALSARFVHVSNQNDLLSERYFFMGSEIFMLDDIFHDLNALVWQFLATLFREGHYLFTS